MFSKSMQLVKLFVSSKKMKWSLSSKKLEILKLYRLILRIWRFQNLEIRLLLTVVLKFLLKNLSSNINLWRKKKRNPKKKLWMRRLRKLRKRNKIKKKRMKKRKRKNKKKLKGQEWFETKWKLKRKRRKRLKEQKWSKSKWKLRKDEKKKKSKSYRLKEKKNKECKKKKS